jgi:hypothetical protein
VGYPDDKAKESFQRSISVLRQVEKQIKLVKNAPANIEFEVKLQNATRERSAGIYDFLTRLFQDRLPQMRLISYREQGNTSLWSVLNAGRGNQYQYLTHLILGPPDHQWLDLELSPLPNAENSTELPNLLSLQLIDWHMTFPGTLSGFQAPKLDVLLLVNTKPTDLSIPGLLDDLQKFPMLHTLRMCIDVGIIGVSSLPLHPPHPSLRHLSLMPPVARTHMGSPFSGFVRLLSAVPGLHKFTLPNLYPVHRATMTQEVPNLTFEGLQIESDVALYTISSTSSWDWYDENMNGFLSIFHHVQRLQLGSDQGHWYNDDVYPHDVYPHTQVGDLDSPGELRKDLDFLLKFLGRQKLRGIGLYLPSLRLITLSKITVEKNTVDLLRGILTARNGTDPCRLSFRGCRFIEKYHKKTGDPQYLPFPDLEELDLREFDVAYECYLEDLRFRKRRGRKPNRRIRDQMFLLDGPTVKLVGNLRAAAL